MKERVELEIKLIEGLEAELLTIGTYNSGFLRGSFERLRKLISELSAENQALKADKGRVPVAIVYYSDGREVPVYENEPPVEINEDGFQIKIINKELSDKIFGHMVTI